MVGLTETEEKWLRAMPRWSDGTCGQTILDKFAALAQLVNAERSRAINAETRIIHAVEQGLAV